MKKETINEANKILNEIECIEQKKKQIRESGRTIY